MCSTTYANSNQKTYELKDKYDLIDFSRSVPFDFLKGAKKELASFTNKDQFYFAHILGISAKITATEKNCYYEIDTLVGFITSKSGLLGPDKKKVQFEVDITLDRPIGYENPYHYKELPVSRDESITSFMISIFPTNQEIIFSGDVGWRLYKHFIRVYRYRTKRLIEIKCKKLILLED